MSLTFPEQIQLLLGVHAIYSLDDGYRVHKLFASGPESTVLSRDQLRESLKDNPILRQHSCRFCGTVKKVTFRGGTMVGNSCDDCDRCLHCNEACSSCNRCLRCLNNRGLRLEEGGICNICSGLAEEREVGT